MSACRYQDHPDALGRLLSGAASESEQAELTSHLETCASCRQTLDALAAQSGLWNDLTLLRDHDADAATGDVPIGFEKKAPDDEDVPLGLLEPTEVSDHLGKLGSYDILRVIGRGGMGVVFLGRDRALERLVAIKMLTPGMAATAAARRRFAREAKAAAAVAHEHVVTIHAVDATPQGIPYLVMQYIPGKSVQDLIDQVRPPELREILRIGSQTARGLAAAHSQGLIHRDIKPANILLENGVERVKITDFGLARAVDDASMTQSGVVAGTPRFMSPEQARGDAIDHRTDLFSLGSVLYALCTGREPFRGNSSMATLKRVCDKEPESIGTLNPDIPVWLARIIARLHAKDPSARFGTADEVANLLGRCLAHVQEPASVPLPSELIPRQKRRREALIGTLAFCLLVPVALNLSNVRAAAQQAADYVATVLRLKTPQGVLVVETDDPGVGIKLDGTDLVVTGAGVKELRLAVGSHNVQALKDGKIVRDELVTIARGGRSVLSVRREPDDRELKSSDIDNPSTDNDAARRAWIDQLVVARSQGPDGRLTRSLTSVPSREAYSKAINERFTALLEPLPPRPLAEFKASDSEVRTVAFSPKRTTLAIGTKAGTISLWGSKSLIWGRPGEEADAPYISHAGGVEAVAFSPDGEYLASGGWDHHVKMWKVSENRPAPALVWDFAGFSDGVRSVAFSPDGRLLATGGFDRVLTVLEPNTGLRIWTSPVLDQPINGVRFSPDGQTLALALGDYSKGIPGNPVGQPGEIQLWRWSDRSLIATMRGWNRECKTVAFSPDGKTLAATSGDGTTRLYDVLSHNERTILKSGPWTAGAAFRPDGKFLATSNWSGEVIFWGLSQVLHSARLQAHHANIPCIAFSSDGGMLATAGADGVVKLWDSSNPATRVRASEIDMTGAAREADRLADVLKKHPPRRSALGGITMQVYMRELSSGEVTLVADQPMREFGRTSSPSWSNDGRRIIFHATPTDNNWDLSQILVLEAQAGQPSLRSLGTGSCPTYSPDDRRIAYLKWGDSVWLMNVDGSAHRRLGVHGAPYWSPFGDKLMINDFSEPTPCRILNLKTGKHETVKVEGHHLISWPRWFDNDTIVAVVTTRDRDESIVLLDVSSPSNAKIVRVLWQRSNDVDVLPRWPIYRPSTGQFYFVGVTEPNLRNLYQLSPEVSTKAVAHQAVALADQHEGLWLSPGGRYLLFNANRPEQR